MVIDFPEQLFQEAERAVREFSTNRSSLVRAAVEQYLEAHQQKRLEEELAVGYVANSAIDRKIAQEFSAVDYETFRMPGKCVRGAILDINLGPAVRHEIKKSSLSHSRAHPEGRSRLGRGHAVTSPRAPWRKSTRR